MLGSVDNFTVTIRQTRRLTLNVPNFNPYDSIATILQNDLDTILFPNQSVQST